MQNLPPYGSAEFVKTIDEVAIVWNRHDKRDFEGPPHRARILANRKAQLPAEATRTFNQYRQMHRINAIRSGEEPIAATPES
jgi:hypothetical protein